MNRADKQVIAQKSVDAMWRLDCASQHLGIKILDISPGCATVQMEVKRWMLNGHGNCHGGFIFTLADSAFAFSGNTYNSMTVGHSCQINYLRPVKEGEILVAKATETNRGKLTGIYDINVYNGEQKKVAIFRGNSFEVGAKLYDDAE